MFFIHEFETKFKISYNLPGIHFINLKMIKTVAEAFLYEADIFKVPFILLFQNRKKSATTQGSLLSIAIFSIVLYLFVTSNMLLKINPLVIDQTTTNDHAALIELSPQNFEVAAGVANSFGKGFSDPTIFKVQFIQIEIGFNETIDSKEITKMEIKQTQKCSNETFSDPTTFNTLGLAEYSCLQNGTFELEGGFDERMVKAVVVMISYCDNATDGVVCQSQTNINNFFKDKGLWLYYQDDIYDVSNYMVPITKNWRLQAIQCATVPRIVDLYLKELIFINDDQFFFSKEDTVYGFMKERSEGLSDYVMVNSPLISINLFASKNNQKTKRQYQKFGDLLASIGGVINVLLILGFFLTGLQNQLQMQNHVMNSLYDYSFEKKEKLPRKKIEAKKFHTDYDWNINYEEIVSHTFPNKREKPLDSENRKMPHFTKRTSKEKLPNQESIEFVMKESIDVGRDPPKSQDNAKETPSSLMKLEMCSSQQRSLEFLDLDKKKEPKKSMFIKFEGSAKKESSQRIEGPLNFRSISPRIKQKELISPWKLQIEKDETNQATENKAVTLTMSEYFALKWKMITKKKLTTKEKLFLLSEKKFKKETDIVYILQKIQEFEKFKMIMLNEKQLGLFDLLAKPLIYLESQREEFQKITSFKMGRSLTQDFMKNETKMRVEELKAYYHALSNEQVLSQIDQNLLILIEKNVFSK